MSSNIEPCSSADPQVCQGLQRVLGVPSLILLGLANAVGAGVFVLTGTAAANYAGPAVALSFALAGLVCVFAVLAYAELAAMFPQAGASYGYARSAFGTTTAWFVGWIMVLEYLVAASTVAVGWSGYAQEMLGDFGVALPAALSSPPLSWHPLEGLQRADGIINMPAIFVVLICGQLLLIGVSKSSLITNVVVLGKVLVIIMVIAFGAAYVNVDNWIPLIPPNEGHFGIYGWSGVSRAAAIAFFSYTGFEVIATAAVETRNPEKAMPVAFISTLLIIGALYIGVCLVITGVQHYSLLDTGAPIVSVLKGDDVDLAWLATLVSPIVVIGLMVTIFVSLYGQTRVFFAMSQDGLLPASMQQLTRGQKPPLGPIISITACALLAGFLPIDLLGDMVSVGCLLAFASVCAALAYLRLTRAEIHRPYRSPAAVAVGIIGTLTYIALVFTLPKVAWGAVTVWVLIGTVIHLLRKNRASG